MTSASARGWGYPGPPGSPQGEAFRRANIVKITAGGVVLWVHKDVARLFRGFINEIVERGYSVKDRADDWGYAHRMIRGSTRTLSNHSWGLAVDLNATTNPMGSRLVTDMPAWVIECAEKWGLSWGGRYKTRPDAMHFEFLGRPEDVARYPEGEEVTDAEIEKIAQRVFEKISGPPLFSKRFTLEALARWTAELAKKP